MSGHLFPSIHSPTLRWASACYLDPLRYHSAVVQQADIEGGAQFLYPAPAWSLLLLSAG